MTRRKKRPVKRDDFSELFGDDVQDIIRRILNSNFWPRELSHDARYTRLHDDHDGTYRGKIAISFTEDGDVWIEISDQERVSETLRYRMPLIGGGMSPRTRTALVLLAEAIRLDNLKNPISHPPICGGCREYVLASQLCYIGDGVVMHHACAVARKMIEPDPPETVTCPAD